MIITIDPHSGFCFGVVHAVKAAEEGLMEHRPLFCLGDIVHNEVEVKRLEGKGLQIIGREDLATLRHCTVLIRAHGEPPETYRIAQKNNIRLIDATCPIVLKLQKDVQKGFAEMQEKNGQVVIFGKEGHPEVDGLVGQTGGEAIVIRDEEDLVMIDFERPVRLFAQTTMSMEGFRQISGEIRKRMAEEIPGKEPDLVLRDSICRQVSNRSDTLKDFCNEHEVIIFVSGHHSSNGKVLFDVCKSINQDSFLVSGTEELRPEWFIGKSDVGISGATSTPQWLMEEVREAILKMS
jgi:4-hydroxy-3-methylbut-2-en-1-yl diphosphate reductase